MDLKEEKKLIQRLRYDPEAFSQLYEHYYDNVLGYVFRRVTNLQIAQDIVSEVFLKAFSHVKRFRWQNRPFGVWLYRIASNEIQTYYRRQKYTPTSLDTLFSEQGFEAPMFRTPQVELEEAEQRWQAQSDFATLHQAVKRLDEPYQTVVALKYFEKKKIKEIAEILGKREGTVKSLLSRGVDKLEVIFNKISTQPFDP